MAAAASAAPGAYGARAFAKDGFSVLLCFMFLYNISFLAMPSATTARLALAFLVLHQLSVNLQSVIEFSRRHAGFMAVAVSGVVYAGAAYVAGGREDSVQLSRLLNFLGVSICGALAFSNWIGGDTRRFHRIVAVTCAVQSLLILYSFFSPEYRVWLAGVVVQGGNNPLTADRPPGFSNSSGAAFSAVQALGVFSCLLSVGASKSALQATAFTLMLILTFVSTIVTGRTGFGMAAVFVLIFFFKARKKVAVSILAGAAMFGLIIFLFGQRLLDFLFLVNPDFRESYRYVFEIAFEIFLRRGEVSSVDAIRNMPIPPLSVETLIGTGIVRDAGGNATGSDSGYVQSYYALGLLMAIFFYLSFAKVLLGYLAKTPEKFLYGLLIVMMFFVESKEPFIFKYVLPFFCVCALSMIAPPESPARAEAAVHGT